LVGESPTMTACAASTPSNSKACSNIAAWGFQKPTSSEVTGHPADHRARSRRLPRPWPGPPAAGRARRRPTAVASNRSLILLSGEPQPTISDQAVTPFDPQSRHDVAERSYDNGRFERTCQGADLGKLAARATA
jgi:hypothetical protein